jgi:peptide deformylase
MATFSLRYLGDPVLKQQASEVTNIDGRLVDIVDDMFEVLDQAHGLALAAPQVGIQKQLFVYDYLDEPGVLINPVIKESDDEWTYTEGCLSIPGIYFEIVRPKRVLVTGVDLDGNDVVFEADELQARMFQHEIDHLHGQLMTEHLTDEQGKAAKKHLLDLRLNGPRKGAPIVTIGRDGLPLTDDD